MGAVTVMRVLLPVVNVGMVREYEGAIETAKLVWWTKECGCGECRT